MENTARRISPDSRIHIHEPAMLEDQEQICLPARLSTLTLANPVDLEDSSGGGVELVKKPKSPSTPDSWEITGVGTRFDHLAASFDQLAVFDDEIYDTNGIPCTKTQSHPSWYGPPSVYSCDDLPLLSCTDNAGQDIDVRSEQTASLTTARTVISDGDRDPDLLSAQNPLRNRPAENQSLLPASPVTFATLPVPRSLATAQLSSSARHPVGGVSWRNDNLEHELPRMAKSLPEVDYQREAGEVEHEKENAVPVPERRSGGASSHQRKSSLSAGKRKAVSADEHTGDDGGDQKPDRSRRPKTNKEPNPQRLWACPFAKGDPWKHPKCLHAGQDKISYVKQHLYRIHGPVFCRRCGKQFIESTSTDGQSAESLRDAHESGCPSRNATFEGKMTYEQAKAVKEAKSRDVTDEERWFQIFDIVCEGTARPDSPYAQPATIEVLRCFQINLRREIGQRAVIAAAASALPDGHFEICIRLVEETVSNFVRRLQEHDHSNGPNPNPNPDPTHVPATTSLTTSPSDLERPPELISSESSTASIDSPVESPVNMSLPMFERAWDFNAFPGVPTDEGRYEFKAGVEDSCQSGAAPQQENANPVTFYDSAIHPEEPLDAYQEATAFQEEFLFGELFAAPRQTTPAELDPINWSTFE